MTSVSQTAMAQALLVLTTLPDESAANRLARLLVEQRFAACVNILSACRSVYRWNDTIEESAEIPLLIKTTRDRYAQLEKTIVDHHPYQLPEIVAVPLEYGLNAYLDWISTQTG